MVMKNADLTIKDIKTLVTLDGSLSSDENPLGIVQDAAIAVKDGKIVFAGKKQSLDFKSSQTISARGAVLFPGLVDSHTHLVFGGSREEEFARRISGVPYMQISKEGGGINYTVRKTRETSEDELYRRAIHWLDEMLSNGVTTIEAKSGYGLDTETELKQLRVLDKLNRSHPIDIIPTFLGAHEFPPEYKNNREAYVNLVIDQMLLAVKQQGIAKFCDVFCEEGVFTIEQSRRILTAAKKLGFAVRFHADEFVDTNGAALAAEIQAQSADHLMAASVENIKRMAENNVYAAFLPGTSYYLGNGKYAEARKFIETGVKVILATDFNPGSSVICNLPFIASLAATQMKMTFNEIIPALTSNPADSLLVGNQTGSISKGKLADLLLLDIPKPEYFIYHAARNHTHMVFKAGKQVYTNPRKAVFLN